MAGQIWEALNGTEGLTQKQIKKATKLKADKDFFLGLGWLLREKIRSLLLKWKARSL